MIEVKQLRYGGDNLGYVLHTSSEALAIDPGDVEGTLAVLKAKRLRLVGVANTHSHGDHTTGNARVCAATGAKLLPANLLVQEGRIVLDGEPVEMIPTPGHTEDSVCFHAPGLVVTGDTLFIANVGNCVPTRLESFRESLDALLALSDDTRVYPGHDYTERSVRRAGDIEPENERVAAFWRQYDPPPVSSTIGDEKAINPYLRTDEPAVMAHLSARGKPVDTTFTRFRSFMELY
ncbi:MBL fold metallo-hydrolase [Planctomycetota bacterium]